MSDLPSWSDFAEIGIEATITTPGSRISEDALRREGADANIGVNQKAAMAAEVTRQLGDVGAGLFLDTAEGERLDRLCAALPFPVYRNAAAPSLVTARFTRPNATKGAGTIGKGYRFALGGQTFEAMADVPVGTGVLAVDVAAKCTTTGPAGNVAAGASGSLGGALWDTSFTITNPVKAAGGNERESDPALRARARAAHETAAKGTLAAVENGALTVDQVSFAVAYNVVNPADPSALQYAVELVVSDTDGNSNAAMLALVETALDEYRGGGIPVTISGGSPILTAIHVRFTFLAGVDTVTRASEAIDRIVAGVNVHRGGEVLTLEQISAYAMQGGPDVTGVVNCRVETPADNVTPASNTSLIRTSRALVTYGVA